MGNITRRLRYGVVALVAAVCAIMLAGCTTTTTGHGHARPSDMHTAMVFLQNSCHLSPGASAGVVGDLMVESRMDPAAKQPSGMGYGIAQWSSKHYQKLVRLAKKRGASPTDLKFQLKFLCRDMATAPPGHTSTLDALKATMTIKDRLASPRDDNNQKYRMAGSVSMFQNRYLMSAHFQRIRAIAYARLASAGH